MSLKEEGIVIFWIRKDEKSFLAKMDLNSLPLFSYSKRFHSSQNIGFYSTSFLTY